MSFIIAVDFDGTIIPHLYPTVGDPLPGAMYYLRAFQLEGAKLILWTMRSDPRPDGTTPLKDAVDLCARHGVQFWGINENPQQREWTGSPKQYAHLYIDDAAFGCPTRLVPGQSRPVVDWSIIGPAVLEMIRRHNV